MPQYSYTLTGWIDVPEGSTLNETGTGIVLPCGRTLKIWESLELSNADQSEHEDLSFDDAYEMDIHYDGDMCRFENDEEGLA